MLPHGLRQPLVAVVATRHHAAFRSEDCRSEDCIDERGQYRSLREHHERAHQDHHIPRMQVPNNPEAIAPGLLLQRAAPEARFRAGTPEGPRPPT
jgi:hypothetical protein